MPTLKRIKFPEIITLLVINQAVLVSPFTFPVFRGGFPPKRLIRVQEAPIVTLVVEIPMSSVQYGKPLDVKAGGKFYLETPMEQYTYSSSGRSNLHRVKIVYRMQSMYYANMMCFFLHFWSKKDASVPWNVPPFRIPRPALFPQRTTFHKAGK